MKKSKIINVETRIERSILGESVEITKENSRPKTQSLIVGDHSSVKLV